ncbi:MAG: hemolysin family protein [Candidatus Sumerlaeaceae bacterium]|nr:hemolysin family protein [Candidatus Sumerlaeaceae bacterium]
MFDPALTPAPLKFASIVLLILLNGFFVAVEFAIVRVRGTKIDSLVRTGSRRARLARHITEHLDAYLSACQLGITIASILLGWIGEDTMRAHVVQPIFTILSIKSEVLLRFTSFVVGTGLVVFLHVVIGEQAPKLLAIQRSASVALWCAYPLHWFYIILYPFIRFLNASSTFVLRAVGIKPDDAGELSHSEEELRMLVTASHQSGTLTPDKLSLLENVFDLSQTVVRQIMVPRTEVAAFNFQKSLAANLIIAEQTAHSRYPLVDGDLDHVVGVIHMKDLFWQLKEMEGSLEHAAMNPSIAGGDVAHQPPSSGADFLRKIAREVPFVPENMRIDHLLREFQSKRVHLAMVVDEYGGTSGMVTFENVIEEIVGEVQDEFDHEAPQIRKVTDNEYILDGIAALFDVNHAMGTNFEAENAETIGGLLLGEFGRLPKPGDQITVDGVELTVREVRQTRVHKIHAKILEPKAEQDDALHKSGHGAE